MFRRPAVTPAPGDFRRQSAPRRLVATLSFLAAAALGCSDDQPTPVQPGDQPALARAAAPTLTPQQSGTTNRLQAVSPVNDQVVWASGTGGTYTVTTDGGATWTAGVVPGAADLQFRDVEAVSATTAFLMAAGPGTYSRIYRTDDGGQSWQLQFTNPDPLGFFDCFDFWTPSQGVLMADAVNGVLPVLRTLDGQTWQNIGASLPPALAGGEFAFAASGTCAATFGERHAWLGTGGGTEARVIATTDRGNSWQAYPVPIVQGTGSSGIFTLAFRDRRHGILGGGELAAPEAFSDNMATSADGGKTWTLVTRSPFPGAVFGLDYVKGLGTTVVITGPKGAAWSGDEGGSWTLLPGVKNYWAVAFASPTAGWLVGTRGRILKVSF